jgi:heptosyltransferase I
VSVDRGHVVDMNLQLASAAGALEPPPVLDFSRFEEDPSGRIARCVSSRTVVLNPGAAHINKRWSAEKFAGLADRVATELQLEPLVIWGPGEEAEGESIAARSQATLAPPTTLRELAFLLRRCRLMISGDTGPLHLAAALGTAVVGLYGPTDPARNGPYGQLDRCVSTWETTRSLETISVDEVMRMARRSLEV